MKNGLNNLFLLGAIVLAFSSAGLGQTTDATVAEPPPEEMEEIVVYGDKSLLVLKGEIKRASDLVFESFNALNDEDEFDIQCSSRTPTGSNISSRSCRPNYEDRIWHEITQRRVAMTDGNRSLASLPIDSAQVAFKIQKKKKELDAKMEMMARENPEFAKVLIELLIAERAFAAEKERRCSGRIICRKSAPE
jgi:hypothetical protein